MSTPCALPQLQVLGRAGVHVDTTTGVVAGALLASRRTQNSDSTTTPSAGVVGAVADLARPQRPICSLHFQ